MENMQNRLVMLGALDQRYAPLQQQFNAIDALNFHPSFEQACRIMKETLAAMLEA